MRILIFANNWIGWKVVEELVERGDEIVGLVVHPAARSQFRDEIVRTSGLSADRILDGSALREKTTRSVIERLAPEIGVSALFGYILPPEVLALMPRGCVNIHTAYLPYNRGAYTNVWGIVDGTGAGVTLHYMDEGVDTGDIIAQREVDVEPVDTGETLYRKLEREAVDLFREQWPAIRSNVASRVPQERENGTCHRVRDVERIDEIDLDRTYTARELIDVLRARTFGAYPGAYFIHGGRRVYLSLQLRYEERTAGEKASAAGSEPK